MTTIKRLSWSISGTSHRDLAEELHEYLRAIFAGGLAQRPLVIAVAPGSAALYVTSSDSSASLSIYPVQTDFDYALRHWHVDPISAEETYTFRMTELLSTSTASLTRLISALTKVIRLALQPHTCRR